MSLYTNCVFKSQQRDVKVKIKVDTNIVLEMKSTASRKTKGMSW